MKEKTINQYLDELLIKYPFKDFNQEISQLYSTLVDLKAKLGGKQLINPTGSMKELLDKYFLSVNQVIEYQVGDKFVGPDNSTYILARVTNKKCSLLDINTGYIWGLSIRVEDDCMISASQFDEMCDFCSNEFKKI